MNKYQKAIEVIDTLLHLMCGEEREDGYKPTMEEMFKELGYQRNEENEKIIYLIETKGSFYYQEIIFNLLKKIIVIDGNFIEVAIETNLLKAINKQANELGWLEEEKQEIKQETNFDHYKDRILDCCIDHLALVKGMPKSCSKIDCNECDFLTIKKECCEIAKDWLKQPYKKQKYKFTQFEYDLINTYSHVDDRCKFDGCYQLKSLKEKGYFKNVDKNELIKDIIENCEIV